MSNTTGKVCIIEDDFTKKIGLAELLKNEGFTVFSGIKENLTAIAAEKPDIIVTDIDDEQKTGSTTKTIETIKSMPELKGVEIFVYTDHLDVTLEVQLRRLKLSSYFTKDEGNPGVIVSSAKHIFVKEEAIDYYREFEDVGDGHGRRSETPRPQPEPSGETFGQMFDEFTEKVHKSVANEGGETLYNLGIGYLEMGLLKEALSEFDMAAKDPNFKVEALSMAGVCLRKMNKYPEAIEKFKEGAKGTSDPAETMGFRYEIGVTLQEMGRLKDAYNFLGAVYKTDKTYRDTAKRLVEITTALKASQQ